MASSLRDVPGQWPQLFPGRGKYRLTDIKLVSGAFAIGRGDVALVEGVSALVQATELSVRRIYSKDVAPELVARAFVDWLRGSSFADYFEEVSVVRFDDDEVEYEFRATGFPGTYVHRFATRGLAGRHECQPASREHLLLVSEIDRRLLADLTANPEILRGLTPRKFEEVMARLIERMGYQVTLTPFSKDDGVDIFAVKASGLSPTLTVVDCKRWDPTRPIGIGLVRLLVGLRDQHRANVAMIATTGRFTKDARDLQQQAWPYEVSLADFDQLRLWLRDFGWEGDSSGLFLPNDLRRGTDDSGSPPTGA